MSEKQAVQGEFFTLLVALRDSRERKLAAWAAAHAPLGHPYATAALLKALRQAGAADQVLALATRAAAHAPLGNPDTAARLLNELRQAGAVKQVLALATRAAAHAPLGNSYATADLLNAMSRAGAVKQVLALAPGSPHTRSSTTRTPPPGC